MDMADMDTQERPRSSSFRSTNSGFVHLTNWRRYSPSTSEEPSMVSTTPVSHPSPVKHRDDQELFMWKELVSSLDDHEQANICTKSIKVRCGNLREESALSGRKGMVLARAPAEDSRPILISTATSMDLLFEHFKSNNTAQMAQFLKEKACIAADGCGSHFHGLAIGRGVKRPADVIDGDSTSDVEEDLEDFLDVQANEPARSSPPQCDFASYSRLMWKEYGLHRLAGSKALCFLRYNIFPSCTCRISWVFRHEVVCSVVFLYPLPALYIEGQPIMQPGYLPLSRQPSGLQVQQEERMLGGSYCRTSMRRRKDQLHLPKR